MLVPVKRSYILGCVRLSTWLRNSAVSGVILCYSRMTWSRITRCDHGLHQTFPTVGNPFDLGGSHGYLYIKESDELRG